MLTDNVDKQIRPEDPQLRRPKPIRLERTAEVSKPTLEGSQREDSICQNTFGAQGIIMVHRFPIVPKRTIGYRAER